MTLRGGVGGSNPHLILKWLIGERFRVRFLTCKVFDIMDLAFDSGCFLYLPEIDS